MGEVINAYKILVGKREGKRPLRKPKCRWEDNIRTDLRDIGCEDFDWAHVLQDRYQWRTLVNTVTFKKGGKTLD
jgi:ribosome biogenesis protein Nip4